MSERATRAAFRGLSSPLAAMTLLALLSGCGSSSSQPEARDEATTAGCDYYQRCGDIGPGKMYETRMSCEVSVKAFWESSWPPADCDGKINAAKLDVCLSSIRAATCGNGGSNLAVLLVNCPKAQVCSGP